MRRGRRSIWRIKDARASPQGLAALSLLPGPVILKAGFRSPTVDEFRIVRECDPSDQAAATHLQGSDGHRDLVSGLRIAAGPTLPEERRRGAAFERPIARFAVFVFDDEVKKNVRIAPLELVDSADQSDLEVRLIHRVAVVSPCW